MRFLLFFVLVFSLQSHAFINVESLRVDPSEGYLGSLSLSGNFQTGNTEKTLFNFNSLNRYLNEKNEFLALANYKYGETGHIKDTHLGAIHLRYSRQIIESLFAEVFVQTEFNEFRSLIQRDLIGLSGRVGWIERKHFFLFSGTGFFLEDEQLKNQAGQSDLRGNFYLSAVFAPENSLKTSLVTYFQPLWNEMVDHRIHLDLDFESPLYKTLSAILSFGYQFDNRPVVGVKKYDSNSMVGLKASF